MNDTESYQQGAFDLTRPESDDAPAGESDPAAALTAREAAKALIRPYVLRGESLADLKKSLMGSANDDFSAQIGGSIAAEAGERRKVRRDQIGVSRVGTARVSEIFSLPALYTEILAEAATAPAVPPIGRGAAGNAATIAPVTPDEDTATALAPEPPLPRIADDPAVLPNRRLPGDFWPEYRNEWRFREENGLPSVSPAEFRDMRDRADGVIAPTGEWWHGAPERPAYPEWDPVSDISDMAEAWEEDDAGFAALPDAPRDDRFIPEGKAVFDARRERLDATIDLLAAKIEELVQGDGYRAYLRMLAKFHSYSANNVALILAQYPDATKVMGYGNKAGTTGWKSLGRHVKEGERGIRIIRPVHQFVTDEETGEVTKALRGFATATVFDISQTEGLPLPAGPKPVDLTPSEAERSLELSVQLHRFIVESGARVVRDMNGTQRGSWDPVQREIGLRADLTGVRALKTLAHETAHLLADHRRERIAMEDAETVAESVAFVLLDHYGIDTSAYSVPYIAGWARDPAAVQRNLAAVRTLSHVLLTAFGDHQSPPEDRVEEVGRG